MDDRFALGNFIARAMASARFDLSASESASLPLLDLLAHANSEDKARWQSLELGYAAPRGADWLRETIASGYNGLNGDDILTCAGAQEATACVTRALLRPGDHAIVVVPIYQPSELAVTRLCPTTGIALQSREGWRLDIDQIAAAIRPETRMILTNFPNSPSGATLDAEAQAALVALCRRHGVWLVNDEVYRLTAEPSHLAPPIASVYERGISIDAISKGLGLPGLRVGWIACRDRELLARVLLAKSMLSSCLAGPSEVLAQIALRAAGSLLARNRGVALANKLRLIDFLDRYPDRFGLHDPPNAAFALPRYLGPEGAEAFAVRLARDAGVLVLPSTLWATPLARVSPDYLRIGLGRGDITEALGAIGSMLSTSRSRAYPTALPGLVPPVRDGLCVADDTMVAVSSSPCAIASDRKAKR